MEIQGANNYRQEIIALLQSAKLPTNDLPEQLDDFLITRKDNQLLGVAGIERYGNDALLRSVAISPGFRNQAIAGQLLNDIETLAAEKGIQSIYLLTETAPEYFRRKGFVIIKRADVPEMVKQSSQFGHVCPQSALVMKKNVYPNINSK